MNIHTIRPDHASTRLDQQLIESLESFQAEDPSPTPANIYVYDLRDQYTVQTNFSIAAILGYAPEQVEKMEPYGLADLIHPDDLDLVAAYYQRFTALYAGETIVIEYRMRRADGSWCWLRSQEILLASESMDTPLQVLGVIQDITPPSTNHLKN